MCILWFHRNIRIIHSSSLRNAIDILRTALNLDIVLGSMDILVMLIFSIHEHGMSFHLFVSSSVSYNFLGTGLLHPWLDLFLGILLF